MSWLHFCFASLKWQKSDYFPSSFVSSLSANKQAAPHIFYGKLYLMLGGQVYPLNCYFTFSLFMLPGVKTWRPYLGATGQLFDF